MISLLPLLLAGQLLLPDPPIRPRVFRSDGAARVMRAGADDYAFFEAFPASGAGTTSACSTTAPTGAKGEALTFTRASSATCTKTATGGLATSGIANGDLVVLTNNQPRVEYDSAGVLGLLVESARTNQALRSEEFDNAAWNKISGVTVTANAGTAPDGTSTAERVQIAATPTSSVMRASLAAACVGASVYARSYPGAGAQQFWLSDGSSHATLCYTTEDSWSRCWAPAVGTPFFDIGTNTGNSAIGAGPYPAADVLLWGAQCESGSYATSYIPTTSAAVTRNADLAYFALTGAPGFTVGSMAASINPNSAMSYATPVATATSTAPPGSGADQLVLYANGTSGASYKCYAGNTAASLAVTGTAAFVAPANGPHRGYCAAGGIGGTLTGGFDTNSMSASAAIPAGPYGAENYLFVGSTNNAITYVDSIVSRICRDPIATRCR